MIDGIPNRPIYFWQKDIIVWAPKIAKLVQITQKRHWKNMQKLMGLNEKSIFFDRYMGVPKMGVPQ